MIIQESVRNLIEFIYRHGDINTNVSASVTMQEGIRIHQRIQSEYTDFIAEVSLAMEVNIGDDITFKLTGRADGIKDTAEKIVIDEIKSTFSPVEDPEDEGFRLHWYQAMLYGAIYSDQHGKRPVDVQLTYYVLKEDTTHVFKKTFEYDVLMSFLNSTLNLYKKWAILNAKIKENGVQSAKALSFPHPTYRRGQAHMAKSVYVSIREGENAMIEAPTGIGKTMATLFPSIKAIGELHIEKIFYLTAKTVQRSVALEALFKLEKKGLNTLAIALQAKEKMCINDTFVCKPNVCPYARGHFDRINDALYTFLTDAGVVKPTEIIAYCQKKMLCPFEFALDITNFAQIIICDYNYLLDPFVHLKRHFSTKKPYVALIDEGHNLHDRSREMYSSSLNLDTLSEMIDLAQRIDPRYAKHLLSLRLSLNQTLSKMEKNKSNAHLSQSLEKAIFKVVRYFIDDGRYTKIVEDNMLVQHYFELYRFYKLYEYYNEKFVFLYDEKWRSFQMRCIDASEILKATYDTLKAVIIFSATLSPINFYKNVLGMNTAKCLQLASPFDPQNCKKLMLVGYSTYSKDRLDTLENIAQACMHIIYHHLGNYLIFCPSHDYIALLKDKLLSLGFKYTCLCQKREMSEDDRRDFIEHFQKSDDVPQIGLVVTGGVFSEGIDLPGKMLSGVIVIGVGLPTLSLERDVMKSYYESMHLSGFDYAYTYPGLNKVFQSGGRLIRTDTDKGVLILIGKRYAQMRYLKEFPKHWQGFKKQHYYE